METLNKALETIPGLSIIFSIAALLMLEESSEVAAAIRVFVVAWLLYWISSSLDWFFDLAYGPNPDLRASTFWPQRLGKLHRSVGRIWYRIRRNLLPGFKALENNRNAAVEVVFPQETTPGIYSRAREKLFSEHKNRWEEEVAPLLNISKAARAFIAPFFLVALITASMKQRIPAGLLQRASELGGVHLFTAFRSDFSRAAERLDFLTPTSSLILFLLCLFLYFWLRVAHMNKLYRIAAGLDLTPAQQAS